MRLLVYSTVVLFSAPCIQLLGKISWHHLYKLQGDDKSTGTFQFVYHQNLNIKRVQEIIKSTV